jgi:lipopolysaccharide biosynthesis protein
MPVISHLKIAICFHLGYNDRFDEFTQYIDNIVQCCPKTDIYITYREEADPTEMCLKKYPNAQIFKTTNGCDTGAFLLQIKSIFASKKKYDYIFKIHTKSNNKIAPNWMGELLDATSGSVANVKNVFKLFKEHRKVGMIAGKRWVLHRDINFQIFQELCERHNISSDGYFVGGTIFWVRYKIIKQIFSLMDIDWEYTLCELGKPSEPSYTHAWERVFGLIVSTCGYTILGV